ncbi:hypothetical protein Tco_0908868 [Tanacetum coccineum]|uniref:Uncharacterized protein n=1 Tax=Tanacetum coccineum TaxID=301880 RepID=A0ABQ5CQI2_9ASTR
MSVANTCKSANGREVGVSSPPVGNSGKTNTGGKFHKSLPEVPGKGKEKVGRGTSGPSSSQTLQILKKKSQLEHEGQAGSDPGTLAEGQAGSDPGTLDEGQARTITPDDVVFPTVTTQSVIVDQTLSSDVVMKSDNRGSPVSSTGTLSSLQHLAKDFSFGDQFLNDNVFEADNEKATADIEA